MIAHPTGASPSYARKSWAPPTACLPPKYAANFVRQSAAAPSKSLPISSAMSARSCAAAGYSSAPAARHSIAERTSLEEFCKSIHRFRMRHRNAIISGEFERGSRNWFEFQRAPRFQILQHRRLHVGDVLGPLQALVCVNARLNARRARDGQSFIYNSAQQCADRGIGKHGLHGGTRERAQDRKSV